MKNFLNKYSKKQKIVGAVAALALLISAIAFANSKSGTDGSAEVATTVKTVELFDLLGTSTSTGAKIITSGSIRASQQADLVAETSGVVRSVSVSIGDVVSQGRVLVSLSSSDASAQVAQAQANLSAQLIKLAEMQKNLGEGQEGSSLNVILKQQNVLVENARRALLSTDLEAVTSQLVGAGTPPTISGTYTGDMSAEYQVTTYGSFGGKGISFNFDYKGLENGVGVASTEAPSPLGTRGLYIQFPENFTPGMTWTISIPNKRSSGYQSRLNAYEAALRGRDVTLSQSRTTTDQIALQEAQIASARSSLMAAQSQLAKTTIRAPFSGRVLSINPRVGEFLSAGTPAVSLLSNSGKEVNVFLNSGDAAKLSIGASATINDIYKGVLIRKAPGIDSQTGKVEAVIALSSNDSALVVGEFANVSIAMQGVSAGSSVVVPLKAVKITGSGSEVFTVENGMLVSHPVTTGSLQGDYIEVLTGLDGLTSIVANVRGLKAGAEVIVKEN